jgi:hypothetical protein
VSPRIVTTNDFVGSFFPQATSYGRLPGAAALQAAVDDLRTETDGALWIDTGDLAQGSALGALSDGAWPFLALRELSVDVSVVGNHELDWGVAHLRRWGAELPYPLLAANLGLGLPATWTRGDVGVVGLSPPSMGEHHPDTPARSGTAAIVREHAARMRADGARHIVLALHDGVDAAGAARMETLCAELRGSVDLVLGGHTLHCFAATLAGVPFLQPWAFGSQVGVADLHEDGRVDLRLVDPGPERPWTGAGASAQAALEAEVVGHLEDALFEADGRESTLARALGEGILAAGGGVGHAYVGPGDLWNQPARDGVHAYLGAGDVTLAQVLRLSPFTGARSPWGGQLLAAELRPGDVERIRMALGGVVVSRGAGPLALSGFHALAADRALGRALGWRPIATTPRDGLLSAVSRGGRR